VSFWLTLSGRDHEEIWRQLAGELKGQFSEGRWTTNSKVEARWKHWTITIDRHVVSSGKHATIYTRIRAPYLNADGFRFRIYRKSIFTGLGKKLGLVQDIEIGDQFFDDEFVIQGNSEPKVAAMCRKEAIRRLLEAQPNICLEVKDDEGWFGSFPEGVDELHFLASEVIKDMEQLKQLYQLFAVVLDYLCSVGSAYERDPETSLS
jgi:hypothetical protein